MQLSSEVMFDADCLQSGGEKSESCGNIAGESESATGLPPLNIAIEGCCHGELDRIYAALEASKQDNGVKIDLLICCGDFQAIRGVEDLQCLACPDKYRRIGTFHEYYSGARRAPIPTLFIGGNHEASNYLQELPYGGWVAPNIFFLGYSGVVTFGGVRIGGISGISSNSSAISHHMMSHFERPPYNRSTIRSIYHTRAIEVFKMLQLAPRAISDATSCHTSSCREGLDIFISHDWPRSVYYYGDTAALLRKKRFFAEEVHSNTLGSAPLERLLWTLRPRFWFSGHLHVKFDADIPHSIDSTLSNSSDEIGVSNAINLEGAVSSGNHHTDDYNHGVDDGGNNAAGCGNAGATVNGDMASKGNSASEKVASSGNETVTQREENLPSSKVNMMSVKATPKDTTSAINTHFLALDKCLPGRKYLQVIRVCPRTSAEWNTLKIHYSEAETKEAATMTNTKSKMLTAASTSTAEYGDVGNISHTDCEGGGKGASSAPSMSESATVKVESSASTERKHKLLFDPEWLAIVRASHIYQHNYLENGEHGQSCNSSGGNVYSCLPDSASFANVLESHKEWSVSATFVLIAMFNYAM